MVVPASGYVRLVGGLLERVQGLGAGPFGVTLREVSYGDGRTFGASLDVRDPHADAPISTRSGSASSPQIQHEYPGL